jgi:hypothetical protein
MISEHHSVPADRGTIDLNNPRELAWWTRRFACSEHQLRDAVDKLGPNAAHIEQFLDGQEHILLL